MNALHSLLVLMAFATLFSSCDSYSQDEYVQQYVVEAYLVAGQSLDEVLLTTTAGIGELYIKDNRGVSNATVVVREHSSLGSVSWTELLLDKGRGVYQVQNPNLEIKPGRTYELEIHIPGFDPVIRARTTVPDTFQVVRSYATQLPYQGTTQFRMDITPSFNPNRQSYYIFTTEALDSTTAELTPFYAQFDENRSDFFKVSSGILNENSTRQNGTYVELVLPWIAVAFYGRNRIQASAIDDNIYDFYRSASTQLGGGTQSPGEIENLLFNIDNAIGIFGSYAFVTVDVIVDKPAGFP